MSGDPEPDEPTIPSRRLRAESHLKHAAQAPIASHAEHYHLNAAIAESLASIARSLAVIAKAPLEPREDP